MKMPRVDFRMTANQSVVASLPPWIRCHGRGGMSSGGEIPASTSWRWVAT